MPYLRLQVGETLLKQWEVLPERMTIGRADDNQIVLPGGGVSKRHAVIEKQGQAYVVMDNGSANGVYVNGRRIQRHTLRYWDEIQIFQHVLKFMAMAKLPGEQEGIGGGDGTINRQEKTMEVDIASLGDLAALRQRTKVAYLSGQLPHQSDFRLRLDKVNVAIGTGRACDIRIAGWFAPRISAVIQRRTDGFYLLPKPWGRVAVNDRRVRSPVKLHDDDRLSVRRLVLKFYWRPMDER